MLFECIARVFAPLSNCRRGLGVVAHALQTWAVVLVAGQLPGSLVNVGYGHDIPDSAMLWLPAPVGQGHYPLLHSA